MGEAEVSRHAAAIPSRRMAYGTSYASKRDGITEGEESGEMTNSNQQEISNGA